MTGDADIWNATGTLSLQEDVLAPGVVLPPLGTAAGRSGPLKSLLLAFVAASEADRSRYSLRLDNRQTSNASDIEELLARPDCPLR